MSKAGRAIGAIIVLVGAVLLIASVFIPWYTETANFTGPEQGSYTANSYPGLSNQNGTIQYSCSGTVPTGCPSTTSYKSMDLNNTGTLAQTGYFLLLTGFVLGLIGAIIGFASLSRPRRAIPAIALSVIAMLLAVATPALFALQLPTAIGNDSPGHTGTGPWSSFMGSNTSQLGFGESLKLTWGPGMGWYLAFGAFVILLIGAVVLARARKEPPSPAPTTVPAPAEGPVATVPSTTPQNGSPVTGAGR